MTALAFVFEGATVHIVGQMTGIAGHAQLLLRDRADVATVAGHILVLVLEGQLGLVVVEAVLLPPLLVVAILTFLPVASPVQVVLGMASDAVVAQLLLEQGLDVTGRAGDIPVLLLERELGLVVVVNRRNPAAQLLFPSCQRGGQRGAFRAVTVFTFFPVKPTVGIV